MNMGTASIKIVFTCFVLSQVNLLNGASTHERNIYFEFYNRRNELYYESNSVLDEITRKSRCHPMDDLTIIIPGWTEGCDTDWTQDMIANMNIYRSGCIVCMNYSIYSKNPNYFALVRDFKNIVEVLISKLTKFIEEGFDPDDIFIFGFSFGAQLALESGRRLGRKSIKRIDVCEPAGPGFDTNLTYSWQNPMDSARFVQCIHTSLDKGTHRRNCHQNWHMGNCGLSQIAEGPYPMGSHGLCPHFYNSAFRNKFYAIERPSRCRRTHRQPNYIPSGMAMGYFTDLSNAKSTVGYDYYANTYRLPPYNVDINTDDSLEE